MSRAPRRSLLEVVPLQEIDEMRAVYPSVARDARDVALAALEPRGEVAVLEAVQERGARVLVRQVEQRRDRIGGAALADERLLRQVRLAEGDRGLHDVAELAHVAGPRVLDERAHLRL